MWWVWVRNYQYKRRNLLGSKSDKTKKNSIQNLTLLRVLIRKLKTRGNSIQNLTSCKNFSSKSTACKIFFLESDPLYLSIQNHAVEEKHEKRNLSPFHGVI